MRVRRIYVEKKRGFDIEAEGLYKDLKTNLGITALQSVRILHRYDISGITEDEYKDARGTIFSEPPVDRVYDETVAFLPGEKVFAVEYLPGQYDQRADSACQCIQMLTQGEKPRCRVAKLIVLQGDISAEEYKKVKEYCINPVESREASLNKPETLDEEWVVPEDVAVLHDFTGMDQNALAGLMEKMGLAMSLEDLAFCRDYFKDTEKRDPSLTEIRLIDTYWSDHCRHTTFLTEVEEVEFEDEPCTNPIQQAYRSYLQSRQYTHEGRKPMCLMDLATVAMKELRKRGQLDDLEVSDEINACSIVVEADVDGKKEDWLVMFKNETHNHPTEIEPFGGAATCLGGAIRDPLSGRSYVYQAMRVTGSGDPRTSVKDTLPGKLPQRKITTGAAAGYSSYGNQIGLATGQVAEIYHEGYVAKRMEIGAVIGAAPRKNVIREIPLPGDVIILLGGRTGRDGCGGATGSSKEHDEKSLLTCGAEVQKGNPPTERKIQRLFRKEEVSRMIKKCNDFGAGGVSVAIGELAEGLEIDLDAVPKKYEGLDGTELAISESQERMAVVVATADMQAFIDAAAAENLEATQVAVVTGEKRLKMSWRGRTIVNISREFLDTNGVSQRTRVKVMGPASADSVLTTLPDEVAANRNNLMEAWLANLQRLNVCAQKGLVERFDSTIGAGTVLMPFGGKYQTSPAEGMAAKLPVLEGETSTATLMSYGFNPDISQWSPFHGAQYAIVESVAKIAAMGGDIRKIRFTLQEYFEKLGKDPVKWGKPFSALLGAYHAQIMLDCPAIGGKDSMSGTFKDRNVPPTLVAFAVNTAEAGCVISTEFKQAGSTVVLLALNIDGVQLPDWEQLKRTYGKLHQAIRKGAVLAAHSVRTGGLAEAVSKMTFGNKIGFEFAEQMSLESLFLPAYGSIVAELKQGENPSTLFSGIPFSVLGKTAGEPVIRANHLAIPIDAALEKWMAPLERIFPTKAEEPAGKPENYSYSKRNNKISGSGSVPALAATARSSVSMARPKVFIPVFPGTNCEYDTARAFERAGAVADVLVIRNLTSTDIGESLNAMAEKIRSSQIVMIPGGFSAGDEPDGSGKFIATAFRNPDVKEAVMDLLKNRDGLMLGICNGFQALIKLGLVPYGEIRDMEEDSPTLTFNSIGRHASCMVNTRIASNLSPWFSNVKAGDMHTIAISHGEGRFVCSPADLDILIRNGQIATQYVDLNGNATYDIRYNPNGSLYAVEGITSPDGRVLGKMGHSERLGAHVAANVPGEKDQKLFEAGVAYFR